MKKGKGKKSMSHSGIGKGFLIGFILGLIIGFMVGGSLTPTGNVIDGECTVDSDCTSLYGAGYVCEESAGYSYCTEEDNDFDGSNSANDCDDNDPNVYPGNYEMCGDSVDNDCDSSTPDTCPAGEECSAGTCMPETTGGSTPPVQPSGECTSDPDCVTLYGSGYLCEPTMGYCYPDPNAGSTPPV